MSYFISRCVLPLRFTRLKLWLIVNRAFAPIVIVKFLLFAKQHIGHRVDVAFPPCPVNIVSVSEIHRATAVKVVVRNPCGCSFRHASVHITFRVSSFKSFRMLRVVLMVISFLVSVRLVVPKVVLAFSATERLLPLHFFECAFAYGAGDGFPDFRRLVFFVGLLSF